MKKITASLAAFLLCILSLSEAAFAAGKITDYPGIKASYYEDKSAIYGKEIDITDSYETLGVQAKAKTDELIPIYCTDTETEEKLRDMFAEISRGKSLESFLTSKNQYFAIAYDNSGNAIGYCILSAEKLEMQEVGKLNGATDSTLKLNDKAVKELNKGFNLEKASAKYCIISGFAVGTLIYDGNSEFFIPSVESSGAADALSVNAVYSVSDLNAVFNNQAPENRSNSLDENGNPYTGAEYCGGYTKEPAVRKDAVLLICIAGLSAAAVLQVNKAKNKRP